ncbi:MAG: LysR family transcriptional regulator [Roseibium sp.]|uniref:LysR family transcriptional regulator n=1 Tax=Roseibium sp. TaxID=1936156 RepID=UPI0026299DB0|nr:LysR family transcriptional regulator [Roseibium sp.]MCV0428899.1 LysR family transcriptional regulator [Roseibium sp.]
MEIRLLRTFSAVAKHMNFSAAARELNTVQPAVSRQISDLEYELNVKLFVRTTRDVKLTAAGETLLEEAVKIIAQEEQARDLVERAAAGKTGKLRIGYIAPACLEFFPALIKKYTMQHPHVQLVLEDMTAKQQIDAFMTGQIDLGFSRSLPDTMQAGFNCINIYTDEISAFVSSSHPLADRPAIRLKDLESQPFVMFERSGAVNLFDQSIAACQRAGFSPKIERQAANMQTVLTHVASGLGVTLAPSCIRHLNMTECCRIPIKDKIKGMPLELQYSKNHSNPTVEAFVKIVEDARPEIRAQMETKT